ncbi:MAG: phosphate ABC transporter permease [Deltaproteobacteria bacterium]|nr:MAG: phosphate ABC transporter permease [Deltaproteobacteria bacterium]
MTGNSLEKTVLVFSWTMVFILSSSVLFLLGHLFIKGIPGLDINLIFGTADPLQVLLGRQRVFDGIFAAIIGTLCLIIIATGIAVPMGICTGIYLAEYAGNFSKKALGFFFDVLTGIPSIVIGLFGFSAAVFIHQHFSENFGPCLLISGMSLAFLIMPYMIHYTRVSLESLPIDLRRTALAFGATRLQNLRYVLIPHTMSGIVSGIILSIGRCAEDTAVILLTGVVVTAGIPTSLLSQYEALPFYIYYLSNQYTDQAELSKGYSACLILLTICAILFLVALIIKKKYTLKHE